jgi:AcrR family transcriptional regulator
VTASEPTARRRLPPGERRTQILAAARELFAQRPLEEVSSADVAAAAGVTRALVHHYFGGISDVYLAVYEDLARAMGDVRNRGVETPIDERIGYNAAAFLDVLAEHREMWLASVAGGIASAEVRRLARAVRETTVEQMLVVNADVLDDTPATRVCLRGYVGLINVVCREWLTGRVTREQTELILTSVFLDLVRRTVPRVGD